MKIAIRKKPTMVDVGPKPRVGSRQFDADVTFFFIQDGQKVRHVVNVQVPASNMLGALGRAGRLAMPKLRKEFPEGKIKLKEITIEIAQAV
jgi:hypothetical protein